jgi:hypothetical protein
MPDLTEFNSGEPRAAHFAVLYAKGPRMKNFRTYEMRMEGNSVSEAREKLQRLIEIEKLREPRGAKIVAYTLSQKDFRDHKGELQTLTTRSLYPVGEAIELEL